MKSTRNESKKSAISFESLSKKEMQNVCGGSGTFYWDTKTKTMYYVP